MAFTNFEPNPMLVNIHKLKLYKSIESKVQDFEIQTSVYWAKPQTTN
jgi:hypothetical protein